MLSLLLKVASLIKYSLFSFVYTYSPCHYDIPCACVHHALFFFSICIHDLFSLFHVVAAASGETQDGQKRTYNVFLGNLPFNVSEEDIRVVFAEAGEIERIRIVTDKDTGRCKFVCSFPFSL